MASVAIPIRVHSTGGAPVPDMQPMQYATGQTFLLGAILIFSSGEVVAASTDPTSGIVGVAAQGANTNPGFDMANSPSVFTGRKQTVTVFRPNDNTIFAAQLCNNSDTSIAPAQANVGGDYGLRLITGGLWAVDTSLNDAVKVVGFSTDVYSPGIVYFKFQPSALADV